MGAGAGGVSACRAGWRVGASLGRRVRVWLHTVERVVVLVAVDGGKMGKGWGGGEHCLVSSSSRSMQSRYSTCGVFMRVTLPL